MAKVSEIMHERRTDREELLHKKLTDHPGEVFEITSLAKFFGVSKYTISRDLRTLMKSDPDISRSPGCVLYSKPDKPDRYGPNKNDEGYHDPTPAKAIANVEETAKTAADVTSESWIPLPGEVWTVKSSKNDVEEQVLVLAVNNTRGFATCIAYGDDDEDTRKNCTRLYSKPFKYFIAKAWDMAEDMLRYILADIGAYLGIEMIELPPVEVPVEVEKIVEKTVEVPVEKIVEVPVEVQKPGDYTKEEVDALLAEQKAAIYEECFKLLASKI